MKRNEHFNYDRRLSKYESDHIEGLDIPWTAEIASIDGAHYHCWIPKGLNKTEEKTILLKFKRAAHAKGDPVAFSFDYIP